MRAGVLPPSSTPIRFGSSRAAPRAASFLLVLKGKRGGVAAKKEDAKTGPDRGGAGTAAGPGGDGAEVAGDRVQVEITPYDLSRGRITYRYK